MSLKSFHHVHLLMIDLISNMSLTLPQTVCFQSSTLSIHASCIHKWVLSFVDQTSFTSRGIQPAGNPPACTWLAQESGCGFDKKPTASPVESIR